MYGALRGTRKGSGFRNLTFGVPRRGFRSPRGLRTSVRRVYNLYAAGSSRGVDTKPYCIMWIARDERGKIAAYSAKPVRDGDAGIWRSVCAYDTRGEYVTDPGGTLGRLDLDGRDFPEVQWETGPVEIRDLGGPRAPVPAEYNHDLSGPAGGDPLQPRAGYPIRNRRPDNSWLYRSVAENDPCADCPVPPGQRGFCAAECPFGMLKSGARAEDLYCSMTERMEMEMAAREEVERNRMLAAVAERENLPCGERCHAIASGGR